MPSLGNVNYVNLTFNAQVIIKIKIFLIIIVYLFIIQLLYLDVQENCGTFPECSGSPDYAYGTAALTLNSNSQESLFYQVLTIK